MLKRRFGLWLDVQQAIAHRIGVLMSALTVWTEVSGRRGSGARPRWLAGSTEWFCPKGKHRAVAQVNDNYARGPLARWWQ